MMRKSFSFFFFSISAFLLCLFFAVSCSNGNNESSSSGNVAEDDDSGEQIYPETCKDGPAFAFDILSTPMVVPYPNNFYLEPDSATLTGFKVNVNEYTALPMGRIAGYKMLKYMIDAINTLDGFSTMADLYLPVGQEPDAITFPTVVNPGPHDSIFLMADDSESAHNGEFIPIKASLLNGVIHLRPQYALHENTHYVLVAARSLKPKDGNCYCASSSMHMIWENYTKGDSSNDLGKRYNATLANLEHRGVAPASILSISEFSTLVNTFDLNEVRNITDELAQTSPPVITDLEIQETDEPNIQNYIYATFSVPRFQNEQGEWVKNEQGEFVVQRWEDLRAYISLPKADSGLAGQPFPVVVYGHPLTCQKEGLRYYGIANDFAAQGFAVAGIDSVCHGDRTPFPGDRLTATLCYFNFFKPLTFRDNIRESVANQMWFVRLIQQLSGFDMIPEGGDGIPDFDLSRIYYLGISLNSIQGGTFATLEKNIDAYVMNVAGAKWTGIALEGPFFGYIVGAADLIDHFLPILNARELVWVVGGIWQHVLDSSDPANFLPHIYGDPLQGLEDYQPYILQQGGEADFIIGGQSGAYYCRAGGWPQVEPYIWDVGYVGHALLPYKGSGFFQTNSANHVGIIFPGPLCDAYRKQALHYLRSHYDTGEAEIINPYER